MAQPVNITTDGVILSGHARVMALKEQGIDEVDVYIPNRELSEKEQHEVLIRMNANIAGIFDWDKAANVFEMERFKSFIPFSVKIRALSGCGLSSETFRFSTCQIISFFAI